MKTHSSAANDESKNKMCSTQTCMDLLFPLYPPIMSALFLILGSAYYAQNYADIIDAGYGVAHVVTIT